MPWAYILGNSLLYGFVVTGYLFVVMISTSPRVWGYADYSEAIKAKVPPQTSAEKRLALVVGVPWFLFTVGFPIYSTLVLKSRLGGEIPFWIALIHVLALFGAATFGDLVLLDWLVVSRITPAFVILPGTEARDYKDFSHHFKGHGRMVPAMGLLAVIMAAVISYPWPGG
jgi:hypothetical protein